MTAPTCQTCGHLRQCHRRLANWEKNEFDGVDGQCYTLTPLADTPRCTCEKYVAPAPPVGACDHVKDNDDQMNGCSTCNPKPVGRETDLRKSVHENWQEYSGRLADALADALRERDEAKQAADYYEKQVEIAGDREADLQRRLDEAVGLLKGVDLSPVGYLENVAAFLAAERKGVR